MTDARRRALDKLLDIYLSLDPRRRESFLSECRSRYPRLSRWFVTLAGESRTTTSFVTGSAERLADAALDELDSQTVAELETDTRLGPWRVIEAVGAGGMGRVYRGERADGAFEMEVAIKLVGSRRRWLVEQFHWECRLLARLDHPAVTRLVDAGLTEVGEPYLVMEWVDGVDLDPWLIEHNPSLAGRLEVFCEVAGAVAHAHQRLVVHGDIKPGNIRIRRDGQVKLMDFGVASLATAVDEPGRRVTAMTPAFAAPEQLESEPVTTRSDVWSLGALLFWLLSGRSPVRGGADPVSVDPQQYPRGHELAAVIQKACADEPDDRYESARALADDIERYLRDEPLVAAPPGAPARLFKFARRKKLVFGSLVAAVVALVTGAVVSTALFFQAELERERAQRHAADLEQVVRFQEDQLADIDTTMMGVHLRDGIFAERRTALEEAGREESNIQRSLRELEQQLAGVNFTNVALQWLDTNILEGAVEGIDDQFADQPLVRARLLQSVANTKRNLALYERANPLQEKALEIHRRELGREHPRTLSSLSDKGLLLRNQGRLAKAESYARQALEARRRVLGDDHPDTLTSISNLGVLLARQGRLAEAESYYREALEGRRGVLGDNHPDTLTSISNTGVFLVRQGKLAEAETYMREALEARRGVLGEDVRATLMSINNLGVVLSRQGKLAEAESYYREVLERSRRVRGDNHPSTLDIINNTGALLYRREMFAEAKPYFTEALEGYRQALGEDHPATLGAIHNMGRVLREIGDLAEAERYGRLAVDKSRKVLSSSHWQTAAYAVSLAKTLAAGGEFAQAEALMLDAHEVFVESLGEDHHRTVEMMEDLAAIYRAWDETDPGAGHEEKSARWLARASRAVEAAAEVGDD